MLTQFWVCRRAWLWDKIEAATWKTSLINLPTHAVSWSLIWQPIWIQNNLQGLNWRRKVRSENEGTFRNAQDIPNTVTFYMQLFSKDKGLNILHWTMNEAAWTVRNAANNIHARKKTTATHTQNLTWLMVIDCVPTDKQFYTVTSTAAGEPPVTDVLPSSYYTCVYLNIFSFSFCF